MMLNLLFNRIFYSLSTTQTLLFLNDASKSAKERIEYDKKRKSETYAYKAGAHISVQSLFKTIVFPKLTGSVYHLIAQ